MTPWPSGLVAAELHELADDVRRLFEELSAAGLAGGRSAAAGDYIPPLDVLEADDSIQVLLDLPGVPPASVRVVLKGHVVLVAGEKWCEGPGATPSGYHLVERGSGRFARAVRLSSAFDGSRATAEMTAGELRIVLPRIDERRGQVISLAIRSATGPTA